MLFGAKVKEVTRDSMGQLNDKLYVLHFTEYYSRNQIRKTRWSVKGACVVGRVITCRILVG